MSPESDSGPGGFGRRLAQARRELGVRQERDISPTDIAALMGVAQATVYRWESGEKRPRPDTIARLAQILGVMPGWLDYGTGPKWPAALVPDAAASVPEKALEPVEEEPARPVRRKRRGGAA